MYNIIYNENIRSVKFVITERHNVNEIYETFLKGGFCQWSFLKRGFLRILYFHLLNSAAFDDHL